MTADQMFQDIYDQFKEGAEPEDGYTRLLPAPETEAEDPELYAFQEETLADVPVQIDESEAFAAFKPLDRQAAEKIMRRYRNTYRKRDEVSEVLTGRVAELQEEIDRLKARADEVQKPYLRRLEWLDTTVKPLLENYARREIGDGKTRSIKLLDGTLSVVAGRWSTKVVDEKAAAEWAAEHAPDALKIDILVTPITKYITGEGKGEIPPGFDRVKSPETFSMKVED